MVLSMKSYGATLTPEAWPSAVRSIADLQSVFEKTPTHRQAQLVKLLMGLASTLT